MKASQIILSGFVIGFSAFSAGAVAAPPEAPIDLICVTEIPTTSFIVKQTGDQVEVQVFNHNGIKYAPFRNTLITPNDMPLLQSQASVIEKLGDEWNFKWKRSSCNADSALFFQCIGDAENFETNGVKVHPYALTVSDVEQKTLWGNYKHKNLSLAFNVGSDGQTYEITMNYETRDCIRSSDAPRNAQFANRIQKLKTKTNQAIQ